MLEDENIEAVNSLLQRRADLMIELTAIEATLGTWISQIRTDPSVTAETMHELRKVNDEIVSMANHIVEIDEQTHARLDMIKQRTRTELQDIDRGGRALHLYAQAQKPTTRFDLKGQEGTIRLSFLWKSFPKCLCPESVTLPPTHSHS